MNRKVLVVGMLMLAVAGGALALAEGSGPKEKTKHAGACPMQVPGAKVSVVNVESGVVIHVTAGDAATAAKIQAAAAGSDVGAAAHSGCKHCGGAKAAVYACSMGDYSGPLTKDGRCPKCGMSLSLKK